MPATVGLCNLTVSLVAKLSQQVYKVLTDLGLQDKRIFVGCSGGRDSMLLAYVCVLLYKAGNITKPCLLHVNHNLQKDSNSWALLVENFARQQGVLYCLKSITLNDASENGARAGRYRAFVEAVVNEGVLLLGHHLDDNAETVLMRLINGSGLQGLGGIRPYRQYDTDNKRIHICRPLLSLSRDEISATAKSCQLPFVDDPTNHAGSTRALIRQLMPKIHQLNPKAAANIHRSSQLLADGAKMLAPIIADGLASVLMPHWAFLGNQVLAVERLLVLHQPLQQAVLTAFIKGDLSYNPSHRLVMDVLALCLRQDGDHRSQLTYGKWVFCCYDGYLYRYHQTFWQGLFGESYAEGVRLVQADDARLFFDTTAFVDMPAGNLQKIDQHTCIPYHKKTLSGKKLYHTLRVPVWLRRHLYLADGYVLSFGRCWPLSYSKTPK